MHILNQGRTMMFNHHCTVDYEGILKMEGIRGLPLASTFKCRFRPDNVVVQITEPLAGAASCQGLKGGSPC